MYIINQISLWTPESISFPLRGSWAELILGFEFIIMYLGLQIFLVLINKFIKSKRKDQESRNLAWGFIILSISFAYFWFFQGDFLAETTMERDMMSLFAYLSISAGIVAILLLSGSLGKFEHKSIKILGILFLGLIILTIILQSRAVGIFISLFIALPVLITYMLFYTRALFQAAHNSQEVRSQIIRFLGSLIFLLVGYLLNADFFILSYGLGIRLIGDIIVIGSLIGFKFALYKLPILTEFDWIEKLRGILIIHEFGVPIFSRFYKYKDEESSDEMLVSGAISSIRTILNTSPTREKLNAVQIGDKVIIFDERPYCLFVIIADENLVSLQSRLHDFADEFMRMFRDNLKDWRGNTKIFGSVEWLVDEYFF